MAKKFSRLAFKPRKKYTRREFARILRKLDYDRMSFDTWIKALTPAQSVVVVLSLVSGMTFEGIGTALGISAAASHRRFTRAIDKLKKGAK